LPANPSRHADATTAFLHVLADPDPVAKRNSPEACDTLRIVAWPDPVIDTLGHDPRSWYVEHFWLGILGPKSISSRPIDAGREQCSTLATARFPSVS
jgi:hypothetical protein